MKKISSYLTNFDAPAGGFSEGKLKDNPGDDTGSGLTVQTHNDFLYAFYALVKKYRTGDLSDIDESETASDVVDALEEMIGLKVDTVSPWSAATAYSTLGTPVMRYGIQFVNINATGNTNKDPVTQPAYWKAVPKAAELFRDFHSGRVIRGECSGIHDYNGAFYQAYFSLGLHKVGGAAGQVFNAWGVHLDGATVTGASELDVLLTGYHLQTMFAPGTPKVLKDARETVDRAMGATGGAAATIGERQEDQGQGHWHTLRVKKYGAGAGATQSIDVDGIADTNYSGGATTRVTDVTDGVNGVPRVGSETRAKSFVTGVPYFVVMVPAA
ncbi:MAG: hypothetical protein IMZ69_05240 [Spirochaetes bacterium]|nr:hypothetical protein [Spirochaetota bacterium]